SKEGPVLSVPLLSTVSDRDRGCREFSPGSCAQADRGCLRRRATRRVFFCQSDSTQDRRGRPRAVQAVGTGASLCGTQGSVPIGQGPVCGLSAQCDLGRGRQLAFVSGSTGEARTGVLDSFLAGMLCG